MPEMTRDDLVAALAEAGILETDAYVEDAVETRRRQVDEGRDPWPLELFVALAQHRHAVATGDQGQQRELEWRVWHLQGNEGEPGLTDEERAQVRAQVDRILRERDA